MQGPTRHEVDEEEHDEVTWTQPLALDPYPGRPWWDVVLAFEAPGREGIWQEACDWPDEMWSFDPLPTPVAPGMVLPSTLGPWKAGTPPAVPTRIRHAAIPVCLTCLRERQASPEALRDALTKIDPRWLWDHVPGLTGDFRPDRHRGHRVLALRVSRVRGSRSSPDMQHLLRYLDPNLPKPVKRFKVEPEPTNELILAHLRALRDPRIDRIEELRTPGRQRGHGKGAGLPKGVPDQGLRARQTADTAYAALAATLVKRVDPLAKQDHVFSVAIETGMRLLDVHLKALWPDRSEGFGTVRFRDHDTALRSTVSEADRPGLDHLFAQRSFTAGPNRQPQRVAERAWAKVKDLPVWLDWQVAHVYLALMAHHDREWEVARAMLVDHDEASPVGDALENLAVPVTETMVDGIMNLPISEREPLGEVIMKLPISETARKTILGDIALLRSEFATRSSAELFAPTLESLFDSLEQLGYPRLGETRAEEARARRERIINVIAFELQRVEIMHVNWRYVFDTMAPLYGIQQPADDAPAPAGS